jgi:hypothetical protein
VTAPTSRPNPFRAQATTSVEEGSFLESYVAWSMDTPTLDLTPVRRVAELTERFCASFTDEADPPEGQVAFVHGAHGAGKTHAVRAAVGRVAAGTGSLLPLYVKLESQTFVEAYRRLMGQLTLPQLRSLVLRFLGSLTPAGPGRRPSAGHDPWDEPEPTDLRDQPERILRLFDEHFLERGLVLEAQAEQMTAAVGEEQSFPRALTYLLVQELQQAAYDWLRGAEVDTTHLRRLGIPEPIRDPRHCRYGLQLLALIGARAGQPVVFILDQCEKFVLDTGQTLIPDNVGLLHSLVEGLPRENGMLVVCGNDEAWAGLPADLRQRFGGNDVVCPQLVPAEATDLLALYVRCALGEDLPARRRPPWPFTEGAVLTLLRLSGGNIRALLQVAGRAFESWHADAGPVAVDEAEILRAAPDVVDALDPATVVHSLVRELRRLGVVRTDPAPGFHLAIDPPGRLPLVIRVSDAIFTGDEARRAQEDAQARIGQLATGAVFVLVIIGYASRDVLRLLGRAYDEVLVYDNAEAAAGRIRRLLVDEAPARSGLDPEIVRVAELLERLRLTRAEDLAALRSELEELTSRREDERARQRFEELAGRWSVARQRLLEQIADARGRRLRGELAELSRLRAERESTRWLLGATGITAAGLALAAVSLFATGIPMWTLGVFAGLVAVAGGAVAVARWRSRRAAAPGSLAEVDALGRRYLGRRDLLASTDPYRRYAFTLGRADPADVPAVVRAIKVERAALLRRALADQLGRLPGRVVAEPLAELAEHRLAELPYLLQYGHRPPLGDARLPPEHRLLLALTDPKAESPELDEAGRLVVGTARGIGPLGRAYHFGLGPDALGALSDRDIRRAIRYLSPLTGAGLGTFDQLRMADDIEQLYLFFEQVRYLRDGGADPG